MLIVVSYSSDGEIDNPSNGEDEKVVQEKWANLRMVGGKFWEAT